jgi:hypothetical protein
MLLWLNVQQIAPKILVKMLLQIYYHFTHICQGGTSYENCINPVNKLPKKTPKPQMQKSSTL